MYKLYREARNTIKDTLDEVQGVRPRRGARPKGPSHKVLEEARRRAGGKEKENGVLDMIFNFLGTLFGMLFSLLCCRRRETPAIDAVNDRIRDLTGGKATVDCERRARKKGEIEALATYPVNLEVQLPADYESGAPVRVQGPHGLIEAEAPADAKPGARLQYRLAPMPDFQVVVPKGGRPGTEVKYKRADGVEISVVVPKGLKAGDSFNITPPALMVQVPPGATAGDAVVFKDPRADDDSEWCRARVPGGLGPGAYFAVRLPPPTRSKAPVAAGGGGKKPGRAGA